MNYLTLTQRSKGGYIYDQRLCQMPVAFLGRSPSADCLISESFAALQAITRIYKIQLCIDDK
jgi:hypothetical protein